MNESQLLILYFSVFIVTYTAARKIKKWFKDGVQLHDEREENKYKELLKQAMKERKYHVYARLLQEHSGVTRYKWKAIGGKKGDGRTRDNCCRAHGRIFYWDHSKNKNPARDDNGNPIHPGEMAGCRCTAVPYVDRII